MCQDRHRAKPEVQPVISGTINYRQLPNSCGHKPKERDWCPTGDPVLYSSIWVPTSQVHLLLLVWEQSVFTKWFTAFKQEEPPRSVSEKV